MAVRTTEEVKNIIRAYCSLLLSAGIPLEKLFFSDLFHIQTKENIAILI